MAILWHPATANALAVAAPIPDSTGQSFSPETTAEECGGHRDTIPVPPAPVMTATPGKEYARVMVYVGVSVKGKRIGSSTELKIKTAERWWGGRV